MENKALYILAGYDDPTERRLAGIQDNLYSQGFIGTHTKNIPQHITLGSFPLDQETRLVDLVRKIAKTTAPFTVAFNHIGIFAGGKVLFAAPDMNPSELLSLRQAVKTEKQESFPWTPHSTILIDDAEKIQRALPVLVEDFHPFMGKITRLHLCAFWPTREVAAVYLNGSED